MFITQGLKKEINELLTKMELRIHWLEQLAEQNDDWQNDITYVMAAERALHTGVEFTTDIASLIIDALVMRDPGSYADILKVLVEESALPDDWFDSFVGILPLRARFIRDHANIEPDEVKAAVAEYASQFRPFMNTIRTYIGLE